MNIILIVGSSDLAISLYYSVNACFALTLLIYVLRGILTIGVEIALALYISIGYTAFYYLSADLVLV